MNTLVVYYSQFGNTEKVAEAMVGVFQGEGTARKLRLDQLVPGDLEGLDLLVLGTPTHRMNLPEAVRPMLDRLPKRSLRGVAVCAFDTSYEMSPFLARMTAAKRIDRVLRKLGGRRLVPPETFLVEHDHAGPLCEGELERAKQWAAGLVTHYSRR